MRTISVISIAVLVIGGLGGCGPGTSSEDEVRTEAETQQALRDSAFGDMTETLDRAREVEQLQLDRKRELDEALDN